MHCVGDSESIGHISSFHLLFTVRRWTVWFCLQPTQEELPETIYNGTE